MIVEHYIKDDFEEQMWQIVITDRHRMETSSMVVWVVAVPKVHFTFSICESHNGMDEMNMCNYSR